MSDITASDVSAMEDQLREVDSSEYANLRSRYEQAIAELEQCRELHQRTQANLNHALTRIDTMAKTHAAQVSRLSDALATAIKLMDSLSVDRT